MSPLATLDRGYAIVEDVETGKVLVEDARGQPPTIPFWFGDRPGRTDELSAAVSTLREQMEARLERDGAEAAGAWGSLRCPHRAGRMAADLCGSLRWPAVSERPSHIDEAHPHQLMNAYLSPGIRRLPGELDIHIIETLRHGVPVSNINLN